MSHPSGPEGQHVSADSLDGDEMGWRKAFALYRDRIQAHVDEAPPLTAEQRAKLAAIFAAAAKRGPAIDGAAAPGNVSGPASSPNLPQDGGE